jgi:hypothetical protein
VAVEPADEFGEDELELRLLRLGDDGYGWHKAGTDSRE